MTSANGFEPQTAADPDRLVIDRRRSERAGRGLMANAARSTMTVPSAGKAASGLPAAASAAVEAQEIDANAAA